MNYFIKPGMPVRHHNYPIGTVVRIKHDLGNGRLFALVKMHERPESDLQSIPVSEMSIDELARVGS